MNLLPRQISAGIALAGMTQGELANLADVDPATLSRVLKGEATPKADTIQKIRRAIESKGIEFIGSTGVQWATHDVRTHIGAEGLKFFFDDVRFTVQHSDQEIVMSGVNEDYLEQRLGDYLTYHRTEMANLRKVRMRCLIEEGDFNFGASEYCKYKWQSKETFSNVPFYVYGDKLAIIVTGGPENPLILLINNKTITEAYRKQFDGIWNVAKEAPSRRTA